MAVTLLNGSWSFADLQNRYERAQSLANDCIQDFAGNYFFPSDRSPKGYWTTSRRQKLDYVCDCPDFARLIDQQMMNSAPSRWVRNDWSTNPDNRILVNRCIHCFAVAIAERELDPRFPVAPLYQAKRGRYPKTDCGCGCGGSGGCGCASKDLAILGEPLPKLIQGCDTECYVESLTPRTPRTPTTEQGIPAYQTFELPTIQFRDIEFKACAGKEITITLVRSTSQGFNNATVSGLLTDIEFSFEPEFKTSSKSVLLDISPGEYVIGISAIASGNFGEKTEAKLTVFDCDNGRSPRDFPYPPCEAWDFVDFGGGECEGSYEVGFRQTGNVNPDGTCEQIKVLRFQEGLDCPYPDEPFAECQFGNDAELVCEKQTIDVPECLDTFNGQYSFSVAYNATVKLQTGRKVLDQLNSTREICIYSCEVAEELIIVPGCPPPKPKPDPRPTCAIVPPKRYWGWANYDLEAGGFLVNVVTGEIDRASVSFREIVETFVCGELEPETSVAAIIRNSKKTFFLVADTRKCAPLDFGYLDGYQGRDKYGIPYENPCCPWDETKPPRPVCPVKPKPVDKWSCSGGVCSPDANGIYNSQAECEAALVPPMFTGGQCAGTLYTIVWRWRQFVTADGTLIYDSQASFYPTGITSDAFGKLDNYEVINGQVISGNPTPQNGFFLGYNVDSTPKFHTGVSGSFRFGTGITNEITIHSISGTPDNCGDLPSTCPP